MGRAPASSVATTNQSIKGPHKATHGQGEATSQHSHRGQQTLRHEVPQAWGANNESRQHLTCATRLGCSVAYSIYSIGGCYTCYIVYYTIVLHSVLNANFGI